MKYTVSRISGVSEEAIKTHLDVDAFEVTRLNMSEAACSAQSLFYGLYNKPIFESVENVTEALNSLEWCKNIPNVVLGSPKLRNINNNKELELAKSFFREYCQMYQNIIAIEALNPIYGTNFATSYIDTVKFIESLGLDRVKVNLDLGSALIDSEKIGIDHVSHIHVSGPTLKPIDASNIDYYVESILYLQSLGYTKYISLESLNFDQDIVLFKDIINKVKKGN